jgi:hypothetical protein
MQCVALPSIDSKGFQDNSKTKSQGQPSTPIDESSCHNRVPSSTGSKERQGTEHYALYFVPFLILKVHASSRV